MYLNLEMKEVDSKKNFYCLFTKKNLPIITFYTKVDKPIKAVTRHLSGNSSSKDTTMALQDLGYDVIIIK
jgi:hypothetical protein